MIMEDEREDVYSKAVRAGKRTYFFDVRSTRGNDLFLTITESKKHTQGDGRVNYVKHKIYLYKEDFDKFVDGLHHTLGELERIRAAEGDAPANNPTSEQGQDEPRPPSGFQDISFDDLENT